MTRRKNLVALDSPDGEHAPVAEAQDGYTSEAADDAGHPFTEQWDEEEPAPRRAGWIVPTLAILLVAGWTGFFGWANRALAQSGVTPLQAVELVGQWAIPLLLVVGLWILAARHSTRSAVRYAEAARLLSSEAEALENRLSVVNRELSLARDFIASQSRDLESLGRVAAERLSQNAGQLQELIRDNGEQVNAIGQVSDSALANMDRLRDQLPVIANAARDVANQIGHAGGTAQGQVDEMVAAFQRLNDFGTASGRQVETFRTRVAETIDAFTTRMEDFDRLAQDRFATLREQDEALRVELEGRETDALAAIRRRASDLSAELAALSATRQADEEEAISALTARMNVLREQADTIASGLRDGQENARTRWSEAIDQLQERMAEAIRQISQLDEAAIGNARQRMDALSEAGERLDKSIIESANAFEAEFARRREQAASVEAQALTDLQERLALFDQQVRERQETHAAHMAGLVERGETLAQRLVALDENMAILASKGTEQNAQLREGIEILAEKLSQSRGILEENRVFVSRLTDDSVRLLEIIRAGSDYSEGALSDAIGKAEARLARFEDRAVALRDTIAEAENRGGLLAEHVAQASDHSAASLATMGTLEARLAAIAAQSGALAAQAQNELREALATLEQASAEAVASLREGQSDAVREIAAQIGSDASTAIEEVLRENAQSAIAELEEAARNAGEQGRAVAVQLRDQLSKVNQLAGNLEARVAQARTRAEEQVNGDFSRRMALITEALNSASIDIARAFDAEVPIPPGPVTCAATAGYSPAAPCACSTMARPAP
jgi:chromosome segregation ATPase